MAAAADYDVLIVGASLAGCAAAVLLGRKGPGWRWSSARATRARTRRCAPISSWRARCRRSRGWDWPRGSRRRAVSATMWKYGPAGGGSVKPIASGRVSQMWFLERSFRSRCPHAFGRCAEESPILRPRGNAGSCACFVADAG